MSGFGPTGSGGIQAGSGGGMPNTSAAIAAIVTDETGTAGSLVFSTGPTLVAPILGAATATSINNTTISPGLNIYLQTAFGGL